LSCSLADPPHSRLTVLATSLLFLVRSLSAATYYVAADGSDTNPGTSSAPFQTLQQAADAALAGDTVVVRDGTYGHQNAVTGGDGSNVDSIPVVLHNSGNPSAWITIKSEHQWGAVLDCELLCDAYINLHNASYVAIQGFVITRGYKEAIHSNDTAHHIVLQGNRFEFIANRWSSSPLGLDGMYTSPNCHDFVIDGNVFHDIGRMNQNWLDHGLYLQGWNFTVINNLFYNIPRGWSIQAADGLGNVLIANNTFAFPNGGGQVGQIMLWGVQTNLTIQNNIFYNPRNYAIARYNSTVNSCVIDHNLLYGAFGLMWDVSGCTVGVQTGGDPNFVNAVSAPLDFHLQANSPAIGAGIRLPAVSTDFDGDDRSQIPAVAIGAYEYETPPTLEIANTTRGGNASWLVGDQWAVTITGGRPDAQVAVTVGTWSAVLGYCDGAGNFGASGQAYPGNIGTSYEVWTVGGARVNPNPLAITVLP
jgi:pectate lyase-like protein/parallel beta helix pectate lyase-like protein